MTKPWPGLKHTSLNYDAKWGGFFNLMGAKKTTNQESAHEKAL